MDSVGRQEEAAQVLIALEPALLHEEECPGFRGHPGCKCYLIQNARTRVEALDKAGLLCALAKKPKELM